MTDDIFAFWGRLAPDRKVHPSDKDVLSRAKHNFDLDCLPEPFLGPLKTAPIVLLYLSPGLGSFDQEQADNPSLQNWHAEQRIGHKPLFTEEKHKAAWDWWKSRTKRFGPGDKIADKIAILNISPYRSKAFHDWHLLAALPSCRTMLEWSQKTLFQDAMNGDRIVICMRSHKWWGLAPATTYGKSLYGADSTRGGHMRKGKLRERIEKAVKDKLGL